MPWHERTSLAWQEENACKLERSRHCGAATAMVVPKAKQTLRVSGHTARHTRLHTGELSRPRTVSSPAADLLYWNKVTCNAADTALKEGPQHVTCGTEANTTGASRSSKLFKRYRLENFFRQRAMRACMSGKSMPSWLTEDTTSATHMDHNTEDETTSVEGSQSTVGGLAAIAVCVYLLCKPIPTQPHKYTYYQNLHLARVALEMSERAAQTSAPLGSEQKGNAVCDPPVPKTTRPFIANRRQRARAKKGVSRTEFMLHLRQHYVQMEAIECDVGDGNTCCICMDPINGLVCYDGGARQMHWGCRERHVENMWSWKGELPQFPASEVRGEARRCGRRCFRGSSSGTSESSNRRARDMLRTSPRQACENGRDAATLCESRLYSARGAGGKTHVLANASIEMKRAFAGGEPDSLSVYGKMMHRSGRPSRRRPDVRQRGDVCLKDYGSALHGRANKCLQKAIIALAPTRCRRQRWQQVMLKLCDNDIATGGRADAEARANLSTVETLLRQARCKVWVVETSSVAAWEMNRFALASCLGAASDPTLGWLLCCLDEAHVYVLHGVGTTRDARIENVIHLHRPCFGRAVGMQEDAAAHLGASASSSCSGARSAATFCAGIPDRPKMELWLPRRYAQADVVAIRQLHAEDKLESVVDRNYFATFCTAAQRAVLAAQRSAEGVHEAAAQGNFVRCLFDAKAMDARARALFSRIHMQYAHVGEAMWAENEAVFTSMILCAACDTYGHAASACPAFHGRAPTAHATTHVGGEYRVELLGRTFENERVIRVNHQDYVVKRATSKDNNCLSDTLRQSLLPDGIPSYDNYLETVRTELAATFTSGAGRVRDVCDVPNFFELLEHGAAIIRSLVKHAPEQYIRDKKNPALQPDALKIVCINLNDIDRTSFLGAGRREILIARENNNHFVPLRRYHGPPGPLPLPWDSTAAAEQLRNQKDAAAKQARAAMADHKRRPEATAAAANARRRPAASVDTEYAMQEAVITSLRPKKGFLEDCALEPADVEVILALMRSAGAGRPAYPYVAHTSCPEPGAHEFIPRPVYEALQQHYRDPRQLSRVLWGDWVRLWEGWEDVARDLEDAEDDEYFQAEAIRSCVERFCKIALDNVVIEAKSDSQRQHELRACGKTIGRGLVYSTNACLADSLLQLLALHGFVDQAFKGDTYASVVKRRELCARARRSLVEHENELLHPALRDRLGNVMVASDEEHDRAYLEHDRHGEALVRFFLQDCQSPRLIEPRGVRIVVYTRFDSPNNDPHALAVTFGRTVDASEPAVDFEMYNVTGSDTAGTHYDPVYVSSPSWVADGVGVPANAAVATATSASLAAPQSESLHLPPDGVGASAARERTDVHPPPPLPHEEPRPPKRCRRPTQKESPPHMNVSPAQEVTPPTDARVPGGEGEEVNAGGSGGGGCGFFKLRTSMHSHDPRRRLEDALDALADAFRTAPTLPELPPHTYDAAFRDDVAIQLPRTHCAFRGCGATFGSHERLLDHLVAEHKEDLEPVAAMLTVPEADQEASSSERLACGSGYNEGIAVAVRRGAPLAALAIDRRALYNYATSIADDNIASLICWCCARRYPYVKERKANEIAWTQPLCHDTVGNDPQWRFAGLSLEKTEEIFGLIAYLDKYGDKDIDSGRIYQRRKDECHEWSLTAECPGGSCEILCCPEDHTCDTSECKEQRRCCPRCWLPLCCECRNGMTNSHGQPAMPPAALANDMMIYYAPQILYTEEVTVMEMICASACLTSMICFSLEKKYRGERAFDTQVHMHNHRMGARGNATSFPLPWQDLLAQLHGVEREEGAGHPPDLPRSGEELSNFVSVLLKSSDGGDTKEALSRFVHQALVRRDVVIKLITELHDCGHMVYKNIDLERMRQKARDTLPTHGIPPQVAKLIPYDTLLDNIKVQKQATPVAARASLETVREEFKVQKPNAVVLEKSSTDDGDINAQRIAAVRHFASRLDIEMQDEFPGEADSDGDQQGEQTPSDAALKKRRVQGGGKFSKVCDAEKVVSEYGKDRKVQRSACATGNNLIDQFEPWYFGIAFAFLFKYCTGMPDMPTFAKHPRFRRGLDAPRIEPGLWTRVMARRVEAQVSRDWSFGFVTWNYVFRSAVNMSRTLYAYDTVQSGDGSDPGSLTPAVLEKGAIAIMKALYGTYTDVNGKTQKVNGDMTRIKYSPEIARNPAAKRLLQNIEHTSRRLPGTQETRRIMRFDTNAHRVRYGVPIFVTFSPDEAHNLLMVRLSRTRASDTVFAEGHDASGLKFCGRDDPRLTNDVSSVRFRVTRKEIIDSLPTYDERRKILARDSLASVDGFRTLVLAAYEYLFGMRVCPFCPDCNNGVSSRPCQDLFGSNAMPEGGIFGRVDAGYTSIEAQKSTGSLHAHSQLFVQCLHQHTPLAEILELLRAKRGHLVEEYLVYKGRVCRQVYAHTDANMRQRLHELEAKWPAYEESKTLISRPMYLTRRDADCNETIAEARAWVEKQAREWAEEYLQEDVQALQEHKQHHVHVYNPETGEREPLQACRRKDKPALCKADFPRTGWIIDTAVILCHGLLKSMGMPGGGRRSKLGSLHGPMNDENLNGTHPAMLAAQRFNSDVQLPYRFPIIATSHARECDEKCVHDDVDDDEIVRAAQIAQDAQAGYACDYCTKRPPMAFNEVKECCKGHSDLTEKLHGETTNYVGKRHAMRLMSDAYGKGIVRGQAENTNLRAYSKENAVTSAESFHTCQTEAFFGREYVDMVQRVNDGATIERKACFGEIDMRNPRKKKVTFRHVATLYGQRPKRDEVWYLSPYEFVTYWEPKLLSYPLRREDSANKCHHAHLTASGKDKLAQKTDADVENELIPGIDYTVKDGIAGVWLPFPDIPSTQHFRHTWILQRRRRPKAPSFAGAPLPRHSSGEAERGAMLTMAYFHPWTLRADEEDVEVLDVGNLRPQGSTWQEALSTWLDGGITCAEAKRYVGNFLGVHRVRPSNDEIDDGHSSDMASDEELEISHTDLHKALTTKIGGRGGANDEEEGEGIEHGISGNATHHDNSTTGIQVAQGVWGCAEGGRQEPEFVSVGCVKEIVQAARDSQRREKSLSGAVKEAIEQDPSLRALTSATPDDVSRWLAVIKRERNEEGKLLLNPEQYEMVAMIATRVRHELEAEGTPDGDAGEPLRWVLHGEPGTGKSHVIKVVKERLFQGVLKWEMGIHFQIVALQAVMAELLGGDTIHHACGIPVFKKGACHGDDLQKHMEVAKRVLQWRWLIIDEISMVSAKLLAQLDTKLRSVIREIGTHKVHNERSRPFGGLNVICSGDFWQLDPPDGGFLGAIPTEYILKARKYLPAPTIAHGQSLLWGGAVGGMQGVHELTKCERCDDVWLREVQGEVRVGALSADNHAFLHGKPTDVPGSWVGGVLTCGNEKCRKLVHDSSKKGAKRGAGQTNYILANECGICKKERSSKALVALTADDERFQDEDFLESPAIFANNDIKYETNKLRAKQFAAKRGEAITYCPAKDSPTPEALRERPDLPAHKLSWLQRHDRESGDLYGIVTLVKGMPVALTDHIDRSPDKQLLRGKIGTIHSWVLDEKETSTFVDGVRILKKVPKIVFVKFRKADGSDVEWTLPGLLEKGLYPIVPRKSAWYLDKGRKHPVLNIRRTQLPLAPAFAMTSHAAQGQTLKRGAVVDLCIGKGSNPLGSYVALTRVASRQHLLIYRPFQRELFSQGQREGPELLLRQLRGDAIDWEAIEKKYMPRKRCAGCNFVHFKEHFNVGEWNRDDKIGFCKDCVERKKGAGTPFRCNNCGIWKSADSFVERYRHAWCLRTRVCDDCVERRMCRGPCGREMEEGAFTKSEWSRARKSSLLRGRCKTCQAKWQECKTCSGRCKLRLPHDAYSKRQWQEGDDTRKCLKCVTHKTGVWKCVQCKTSKEKNEFSMSRNARQTDWKCLKCEEKEKTKTCSGRCKRRLSHDAYSKRQWEEGDDTRRCLKCVTHKTGFWKCVQCKTSKEKNEFSMWRNARQTDSNKTTARCNPCQLRQNASRQQVAAASLRAIMKHTA